MEPPAFDTIHLPKPPRGWFDHSYAVLMDGTLGISRTSHDLHAEMQAWRARVSQSQHTSGWPNPDHRRQISAFDGVSESGAIDLPKHGLFPAMDRSADGRWLVVEPRSDPETRNARFYRPDGRPAGEFHAGDGIERIRCAPDGTVWVGYFDEGVFGGQTPDGQWPVGSSGIARFDSEGQLLWGFNDPAGEVLIADCDALTLDGNVAWACTFTDFPILKIDNGQVRIWKNEVSSARALAVDGHHVLIAGGYRPEHNRLALVRLSEETNDSALIGEIEFDLPSGGASLIQGRGDTLHVVGDGRWTKISVEDVRQALSV